MTDRAYPRAGRFFARLDPDRPLFQGDIVRGAFGAWWRHPATVRATLAGEPVNPSPDYPGLSELLAHSWVRGQGYGMLLPQPCEFAEAEKGETHPFRLVAPVLPLDRFADVDHVGVRRGGVGHTFWVPRWRHTGPQDFYVDLRLTCSIDRTFVRRDTRVAALSRPAWVALADRLSRYFVGIALDTAAFVVEQSHLHPDSPASP